MVKGISRRVVVVDAPDQRLFEQAIFILRNDAAEQGVSSRQVVEEARRVARDYAAGERSRLHRFAPLLWSLLGAGVIGGLWLLLELV